MNTTSNQGFILPKLQSFLVSATVVSSLAFASAVSAQEAQAPVTADGIKIGFVNTEKILRDSKPAKEAQTQIEEEFGKRDEELQKLADNLRKKIRGL